MINFIDALRSSLKSNQGIDLNNFYNSTSRTEKRILKEYGAVFLSRSLGINPVKLPPRCRFASDADASNFVGTLNSTVDSVGGVNIKLQKAAMDALKIAESAAKKNGQTITPNDPKTAAARNNAEAIGFWNNRVKQGIDYWKNPAHKNAKGEHISPADLEVLQKSKVDFSSDSQVEKVLELEDRGFSFHPNDKSKSITVFVAIPNSSQHLLLLALDIKEYADKSVRKALADNGWFQTVLKDRPHFTFLGLKENQLDGFGLKKESYEGKTFWIPNGV
jgi:hypothetical protein